MVRLLIERWTNGAWSMMTVSLAPESFCSLSSLSRTCWEICTGLPSGLAVTATPRLSTPSVRVYDVAAGSLLSTVATSPSLTGPRAAGQVEALERASTEVIGVPTCTLSDLVSVGDRAGRDRDAVGLQHRGQRPRVDAGRGELGQVGRDHDLGRAGAGDLGVADAGDRVELGDDGLVELV